MYRRRKKIYGCVVSVPAFVTSRCPPHTLTQTHNITHTHTDLGFYKRMAALEKQFKGASVLLHKTPDLPPSFRDLWSDKRLLDIAQQLLGGEKVDVAGHPVWNLRVKVPQVSCVCVCVCLFVCVGIERDSILDISEMCFFWIVTFTIIYTHTHTHNYRLTAPSCPGTKTPRTSIPKAPTHCKSLRGFLSLTPRLRMAACR